MARPGPWRDSRLDQRPRTEALPPSAPSRPTAAGGTRYPATYLPRREPLKRSTRSSEAAPSLEPFATSGDTRRRECTSHDPGCDAGRREPHQCDRRSTEGKDTSAPPGDLCVSSAMVDEAE